MQPLLWTLAIALLAGAGAACALLGAAWRGHRNTRAAMPAQWALTPRPVFSTQERRCYRALREALPHHIILAKLPLVRFCQPASGEDARHWYHLLGSIHVAMAICSANGRVLAAIDLNSDLDDVSMRSVQIKLAVMKACGVRYVRCPPDSVPSAEELRLLVPRPSAAASAAAHSAARASSHASPHAAAAPASAGEHPTDAVLHSLAARRAERASLWQDSTTLHDSFFFVDSRIDSANRSAFGGLYPAAGPMHGWAASSSASSSGSSFASSPPTAPAVWSASETPRSRAAPDPDRHPNQKADGQQATPNPRTARR